MPTPSIMKKQNSEKNKKQKTEDAVNAADMILNKIDLHKLKRFQDAFTWKRNMVFESIKKLEEVQRDITRMRCTYPFNISTSIILKELDGIDTHLQSASRNLCKYNTQLTDKSNRIDSLIKTIQMSKE